MKIKIDGELLDVQVVQGREPCVVQCGRRDFYVFESSESAGKAVVDYYRELRDNDKREFCAFIGDERLIQWACGENDEFGIGSFDEFLERVAEVPEEHWASYDGQEREVEGIEDIDDDEKQELLVLANQPDDTPAGEWEARLEDLVERRDNYQEWQQLIDELGFTPTVAYRAN